MAVRKCRAPLKVSAHQLPGHMACMLCLLCLSVSGLVHICIHLFLPLLSHCCLSYISSLALPTQLLLIGSAFLILFVHLLPKLFWTYLPNGRSLLCLFCLQPCTNPCVLPFGFDCLSAPAFDWLLLIPHVWYLLLANAWPYHAASEEEGWCQGQVQAPN